MRNLPWLHFSSGLAILLFQSAPMYADLTLVDMFRNVVYNQTSGVPPASPSFDFLNLEAFMQNPTDFTSASVTYAGPGSPANLPPETSTKFGIGPSFATQAAMDAAFPFGTYSFTASGGTVGSQSASLNYSLDAFTSDIPALTAVSFSALQGMNVNLPFTFNFNSFTPNSNANVGATFLTVFGSSFSDQLSNSATSAIMPANTLLPGTTYTYELDFSDRINGIDNGVPTLIGFDVRTDGTFTTSAVPEPSMLFPTLVLIAVALGVHRLRSRTPQA